MKYGKYLVGGIALSMFAATPVYAQTESGSEPMAAGTFVAEVSLYGGLSMLDTGGDEDDSNEFTFGGGVKLGFNASENIGAQVDFLYEGTSAYDDTSFSDEGRENMSAAVHLFYRNSDYAAGVFGGMDQYGVVDEGEHRRANIGVEGQYFLGNTTLYAQAGRNFMTESEGDDHGEPVDFWFGRFVVRQFITPNDKIEAEFAYFKASDVETGNQGPVAEMDWGLSYEHRFAGMPVGGFVKYVGYRYDDQSHSSAIFMENIALIGLTVYFNQTDLKTADRRGTSFDTHMWRGMNWLDEAH